VTQKPVEDKPLNNSLVATHQITQGGINMANSSKKYMKILVMALTFILFLSVGTNLLLHLTGFGNTGSMRTGRFTNTSQGVSSNGWFFYAKKASGHSTFFANLSQVNIDNILIESQVCAGEVMLTITQGNVRLDFDLSGDNSLMGKYDLGAGMLEPGRVEMRLYFTEAQNVDVVVSWRDGR
jgi:hypothetical protein